MKLVIFNAFLLFALAITNMTFHLLGGGDKFFIVGNVFVAAFIVYVGRFEGKE